MRAAITSALPAAPGEVLDVPAWFPRMSALSRGPGGVILRHSHTLRACVVVDGVASGDPREDLAPTALRMALSDKARHTRIAGARFDWIERVSPRSIVVDGDATIMRGRLPHLARALGVDPVVDRARRCAGERGFMRTFPTDASMPVEVHVDDRSETRGVAAEAGTLHLHHEDAWVRAGRNAPSRRSGE